MKKGPGRRPLSAKRQRFMELRAQGWSIRGAAREVGISRSAAANWTRGYTVYRDGVAVKFVEPLDRLEVRAISPRFLSQQERCHVPVGVDPAVKVAGPPRRTAYEGARGCTHAAGQSIRRYRPWFTVCDVLRVWRLVRA